MKIDLRAANTLTMRIDYETFAGAQIL